MVQVQGAAEMICYANLNQMGIAADILGLRNSHFSSVAELLAALDQVSDAPWTKYQPGYFWLGQPPT